MTFIKNDSNFTAVDASLCEELYFDWFYIVATILIFIFSVCGIFYNVIVSRMIKKIQIFPLNARYLLAYMINNSTCIAVLYLVTVALYNIILMIYRGQMPIDTRLCSFISLLAGLFVRSAFILPAIVCLEIFVSTRKHQFSESETVSYRIKLMIPVVYLILFVICFAESWENSVDDRILCYCSKFFMVSSAYEFYLFATFLVVEFTAIVFSAFSHYLYLKSYHGQFTLDSKVHSLQKRFQMANNIRALKLLTQFLVSQGLMSLMTTTIILIDNYTNEHKTVDMRSINIINAACLVIIFGSLFIPIFWIKFNKEMKHYLLNNYSKFVRRSFLCFENKIQIFPSQMVNVQPIHRSTVRPINFNMTPGNANELLESIWASKTVK
uniref:G-protein coupled receptors family 1 profile domain-containing protein n=1 Tax=Romanomermis culicivorax TaxID=13658 RepID=A0A915KUW9_ROMCU